MKVLKVASVYGGLILGAGFASGREIVAFFVAYGYMGIVGLVLSGIIFSFVGFAVMDICMREEIDSYNHFIKKTMGNKLGTVMESLSMVFIFVLLCAMLAAGGAVFRQIFGTADTIGVLIIAVLCFITILFDLQGFIKINTLLIPILVVGGMTIGLYSISQQPSLSFLEGERNPAWIRGAIIYSSYNIIAAITILCELRKLGIDRKTAKLGSILGGIFMTALGICLAVALYMHYPATTTEIPVLTIVSQYGSFMYILYFIILFTAIYTTAIGNAFSLVNYLKARTTLNSLLIKALILKIAVIFAHIGFSNFISTVYPVFGYVGLFKILIITLFFVLQKKGRMEQL